jgi:hypothetical protein
LKGRKLVDECFGRIAKIMNDRKILPDKAFTNFDID